MRRPGKTVRIAVISARELVYGSAVAELSADYEAGMAANAAESSGTIEREVDDHAAGKTVRIQPISARELVYGKADDDEKGET